MISASPLHPCPVPIPSVRTGAASCSSRHFCNFGFNPKWAPSIPFPWRKSVDKSCGHDYRFRPARFCALKDGNSSSSSSTSRNRNAFEFDVVIIGAGIIGLTIARQFLIGSDLSVAVVDKAVPCSGATGAGQGYLWMVHKSPGSDIWELALRSHRLWEGLAETLRDQGLNPSEELGWKKTGSLLIGRTPEELDILKRKVKQLSEVGLEAEFLSGVDLLSMEPALSVGDNCGAAFVPNDCQLDAHRTVAFIEKANRHFKGRYAEFYHHPVTGLLRSGSNGKIEAVQTSKTTLHSKKAIVLAAGCWSGTLLRDVLGEEKTVLDVPIMPRKGHLLVIENFNSLHLNHGLMEVGYVNHQTLTSAEGLEQTSSISMTATMDVQGNLVLDTRRQLAIHNQINIEKGKGNGRKDKGNMGASPRRKSKLPVGAAVSLLVSTLKWMNL
ncbi:uncharacterized protein LOC111013420 isoform X2 [Momordica charantia]|uniref:FAD-dependent oxidoreductase domain-containing protein 1 n=1 Tax=Momordica charantia TaxID=3673 RepID=A0A6J1CQZ1_MOMCH|nr:uncharacterized protein LOC111013420 isoform X2 [Momordica charantia]